jgi:hypothetical protein
MLGQIVTVTVLRLATDRRWTEETLTWRASRESFQVDIPTARATR